MSTNLEDLAVTTGLEKVNPHRNPKKDSTKECSNHWTIALISHATKVRQSQIAHSCLTLHNLMDCIACQALLSIGFPRQEYGSGLLFPSPEDLPKDRIHTSGVYCIIRWILYL